MRDLCPGWGWGHASGSPNRMRGAPSPPPNPPAQPPRPRTHLVPALRSSEGERKEEGGEAGSREEDHVGHPALLEEVLGHA